MNENPVILKEQAFKTMAVLMAFLMALKELQELQGNEIKVYETALTDRTNYFYSKLKEGVSVDDLEKSFVSRKTSVK